MSRMPATSEIWSINPEKNLEASMIRSLKVKSAYLSSGILADPNVYSDVEILVDNLTDLLQGKLK